jgi:5'-nucleotidase
MNILLTNDDGINSDGILKLAEALRSGGNHKVTIIAPDVNRSGVSHALSFFNNAVKLYRIEEDTWSCTGFPADCIIAGLGFLPERPDIVLSGINRGENLGTDLIYSGTAAAARQGGLAGIPSIALSLAGSGPYHWDMAVSWTASHLEELFYFFF